MTARTTAVAPPTAEQVRLALLQRYAAPEWHTESEFTLEGRRIDVFAMNRWGARSYRTVGFEIKVSRGDWRRELEDFRKSEIWTHVVDQFYVVAPGGVVALDELPQGWGLLELRGSRMFTKRQALIGTSATLPRELAARMIDRLLKQLSDAEWRISSEVRVLTEQERYAVRAEVEERLRKEREANSDGKHAQLYRDLMGNAGLAFYDNPIAILSQAKRLVAASEYLQNNDALQFAISNLRRAADGVTSRAAEFSDALKALRTTLAAASSTTPTPTEV